MKPANVICDELAFFASSDIVLDNSKLKATNGSQFEVPEFIDSFEHLVYLELLCGHEIEIPVVADIPKMKAAQWIPVLFNGDC